MLVKFMASRSEKAEKSSTQFLHRPKSAHFHAYFQVIARNRFFGRDDRIRTCDPHTPSVMRYQAALRPDRQRARCACWKRAYMAALW